MHKIDKYLNLTTLLILYLTIFFNYMICRKSLSNAVTCDFILNKDRGIYKSNNLLYYHRDDNFIQIYFKSRHLIYFSKLTIFSMHRKL